MGGPEGAAVVGEIQVGLLPLGLPLVAVAQVDDIFRRDPQFRCHGQYLPAPDLCQTVVIAVGGIDQPDLAAGLYILLQDAAGQIQLVVLMGNQNHYPLAAPEGGFRFQSPDRHRKTQQEHHRCCHPDDPPHGLISFHGHHIRYFPARGIRLKIAVTAQDRANTAAASAGTVHTGFPARA